MQAFIPNVRASAAFRPSERQWRHHCSMLPAQPSKACYNPQPTRPTYGHRHVCNAQENGTHQQHQEHKPQDEAAQAASADDPVDAMLYVAQQEMGMNVVWADEDDAEEEWEEAIADLEDVWMRNPAPPEWAEATGMLPSSSHTSSTSSGGANPDSSTEDTSRNVATITWPELQQQQQHRSIVVLQIASKDEGPDRPLPNPLPWADTAAADQQLQHSTLQLSELTRDVAAAWQDSTVAVLDTGHHTCLAAAIRLSAVYRLPNVVLLQLQ